MSYCFDKKEASVFIESKILQSNSDLELIKKRIDNAQDWVEEIVLLSYFLAIFFERKKTLSLSYAQIFQKLNNIINEMYICLQEFDVDYLDYLLKNVRDKSLNLEEELVELQNSLSDYNYAKTLRM